MFKKSILLGTLGGFLTHFILGFLFYGLLAADFFASHAVIEAGRDPMNMGFITFSSLFQAFFLSVIYKCFARDKYSLKSGFKFGVLIGLFYVGVGFMMYGTMNLIDCTALIVDSIYSVLFYGIIGAVIGLIFKATTKKK